MTAQKHSVVRNVNLRRKSRDKGVPVPASKYDDEYYMSECSGHDAFNTEDPRAVSSRLGSAIKLLGSVQGKLVLDIGCGRGEICKIMALKGAHVVGTDYSSSSLRISIKSSEMEPRAANNTSFVESDAKYLPLITESFDVILMLEIVEHLHPWELELALRNVFRILKPGGMFLVHTAPNKWRWTILYTLARFLVRAIKGTRLPRDGRSPTDQQVHVNEQTPFSLWRNLRRAGFATKLWTEDAEGKGSSRIGFSFLGRILRIWPLCFLFGFRIWAIGCKSVSSAPL